MGEVHAVMNGVEFRTRHNDYKLRMKSRTDPGYGKLEVIPFPDVPPEVLALDNVTVSPPYPTDPPENCHLNVKKMPKT